MIDLIGGPDRDRTDDLFHAMEARSQLRHRPTLEGTLLLSRHLPDKSNAHAIRQASRRETTMPADNNPPTLLKKSPYLQRPSIQT